MADTDFDEVELRDRRVAYYSAWLGAWIKTRMEKDKQLLTLSALATGLLVTALKNPETAFEFVIWATAALCFIVVMILILLIFGKNADYIEVLITEDYAEESDKKQIQEQERKKTKELNRLTKWAFGIFILGGALTIFLVLAQSGFILTKGN